MTRSLFESATTLRPLRPHQEIGLAMLRAATSEENKRKHERPVRIIFAAPCSWGKTRASVEMFMNAIKRGYRCLFLVPALNLVDQAIRDFEADGLTDIGVIQGNHPRTRPYASVQVASIQTLMRRKLPAGKWFVIWDEAHLVFQEMLKLMDSDDWSDYVVIGLTGTPGAKGMGKHWNRMVIPHTLRDMMEAGLVAPYRAYVPAKEYMPDMSGVRTVAGDFDEGQTSAVMSDRKLVGHVVDHWLAKAEGRRTFLYAVDCGHARLLQQQFIEHGIPWAYLDGDTPMDERREIFGQLRRGDVRGISSVATLIVGVDEKVECIIDCAPTKSKMRQGQKIPRMLRLDPDMPDKIAILLDHGGNCERKGMGLVEDFIWNQLDDGKPKTKEQKAREEREAPLPRRCQCGVLLPVGVRKCPQCGKEKDRVSDVVHVPGQLVEYGSNAKGKKGADKYTQEYKDQFYGELLSYARSHGKKDGWAYYTYRDKFSVHPAHKSPPQEPSFETVQWIKARNIRRAKAMQKEQREREKQFQEAVAQ